MEEQPLAFLRLIKVLEEALGQKTSYRFLEPFSCVGLDNGRPAIIPIQQAARKIAQHVGLGNLMFIISATEQDPSWAGHIELQRDSSEVYVEISPDICRYEDAVLATLCHEVAHKVLHVNAIHHGFASIEQEYLTDVATVYLGMGKVMLNGCECQKSHQTSDSRGTSTHFETLKTGYISRDCFAFVYRVVCAMRNIPSSEFLRGLSGPAIQALRACEKSYGDWFRTRFDNPGDLDLLMKALREDVVDFQDEIACNEQVLRETNKRLVNLTAKCRDSHKRLFEANVKVKELERLNYNPHISYLNCLETKEAVADLICEGSLQVKNVRTSLSLLQNVNGNLPTGNAETTDIIECPIDQVKLCVPAGRKRFLVTCPKCNYQFIVKTLTAVAEPLLKPHRNENTPWRLRLRSWFRSFVPPHGPTPA